MKRKPPHIDEAVLRYMIETERVSFGRAAQRFGVQQAVIVNLCRERNIEPGRVPLPPAGALRPIRGVSDTAGAGDLA